MRLSGTVVADPYAFPKFVDLLVPVVDLIARAVQPRTAESQSVAIRTDTLAVWKGNHAPLSKDVVVDIKLVFPCKCN